MDRIVSPSEVRQCVFLDPESLACVTGCFSRHTQGRVGPAVHMEVPLPAGDGPLTAAAAVVDGVYSFGLRLAAPGGSQILLLDPGTGAPQALLRDQEYLRESARALAGAVAGDRLAPEEVRVAGVLGAGPEAARHLAALALVRDIGEILVDAPPEALDGLPEELQGRCRQVEDAGELSASSQVLLVAGDVALEPGHVHPGLHVNTVGRARMPATQELRDAFDVLACDVAATSGLRGRTTGELVELGQLTTSRHPGRSRADQLTLCHLEDAPMLDTALGWLAWRKSQKYKLGVVLPGS